MIYLVPLFLLIIGYIVFDRAYNQKAGRKLWVITYLTLVLIFGLRYKVGGDTYNYMTYFEWAPTLEYWSSSDASLFEPGFTLFTSAIKSFTDNVYTYQTIISALMTFMLMLFVKRNTDYKYLAMILIFVAMYFYFSTEVIRESLAVCILLLSYPLLDKKRYISYYAVCLFMLTLHYSAVICLFLPIIRRLKFNVKFAIYIFGFVLIGGLLATIMESMAEYYIFHKLLRYAEYSYVGYAWCGLRFVYFSLLPMLTLHLCKSKFHLRVKYENIICFQILLGFGLWSVPIVFQRLINYTIIFYLVALADVLGTVFRDKQYRKYLSLDVRSSRTQIANVLLFLTIIAHGSYYIHLNFYELYIPYHSIMDPIEEPMREKYVAGQQ